MDNSEILTGLIIIPPIAIISAYIDKKFKFMQTSPLYKPEFWKNILINASFLIVIYIIYSLFT